MSCLASAGCAAAAAELLGVGMQAAGMGIPVCETGVKLMDGMRNCGLPMPPKSWFKKSDQTASSSGDDKKSSPRNNCNNCTKDCNKENKGSSETIYDKLEAHVNGMIQVAKPVIELKKMMRENCCRGGSRSADRMSSQQERSPKSPKDKSFYYTPQKPSSGFGSDLGAHNSASPKEKEEHEMLSMIYGWKLDAGHHSSLKEKKSCINCSRSSPLVELPCGRLICTKCDSTGDHELESERRANMPRRTRTTYPRRARARAAVLAPPSPEPAVAVPAAGSPPSTPQPVPSSVPVPRLTDVIDLTQDSPSNAAFRQSRVLTEQNIEDSVLICDDEVPIASEPRHILKARRRNLSKPAVIINLDETDNQLGSPDKPQTKSVPTNNNKNSVLSCPVCLDSLADENVKAMTTPCGHVYCLDCLKNVTQQRKRCCICQRPITFAKCIRLHI
ncbi:hypothetical protein QAD02_004261 [Eretmocerus hayati]|uniref:Uncharacterized protein n=1 Tax=Eretmocerus hayati TaxID=131215 RepID=A0ACC2NP09_9HYME|nr:hypothetical protein QAD02_004261 [Eretmocerus hayati]